MSDPLMYAVVSIYKSTVKLNDEYISKNHCYTDQDYVGV